MTLRAKFDELHDFVTENIHLAEPDLTLRNKAYNTEVMFGFLTSLLKEKTIYVGEYGLGKTSLSETVASLTYKIPQDNINSASLKGNPGLTEEDIIGRPDLGKLNVGEEEVIWSNFLLTQPKIVDELNRITPDKQSILLNGMESGIWNTLNSSFNPPEGSWFATMNYSDKGNGNVIPALLDRFSLMVEAKSPDVNTSRMIRNSETYSLDTPDITNAYEKLMQEQNLDMLYRNIKILREDFKASVEDETGITLFEDDEFSTFQNAVHDREITQESEYFLDVLNAELNTCQRFGSKRGFEECPDGCHFINYACNKTKNGLSVRTQDAIKTFGKALAYLDEQDSVHPDHLEKVVPYAARHKINVKESFIENYREVDREETARFTALDDLVTDIRNRFTRIRSKQEAFTKNILEDDVEQARKIADDMDHPVFNEYLK